MKEVAVIPHGRQDLLMTVEKSISRDRKEIGEIIDAGLKAMKNRQD